jgi:hypothetical protein
MSRYDDLRKMREARFEPKNTLTESSSARQQKARTILAQTVTLPKAAPVTLQPHPDCPVCTARRQAVRDRVRRFRQRKRQASH